MPNPNLITHKVILIPCSTCTPDHSLFVCMYMHVCVYVYTYIYTHMYVHAYEHSRSVFELTSLYLMQMIRCPVVHHVFQIILLTIFVHTCMCVSVSRKITGLHLWFHIFIEMPNHSKGINPIRPSDAQSPLAQLVACCLTTPSHCLYQ